MPIVAFAAWVGQGGYAPLAVFVIAVAMICIVAVNRPPVLHGRRSTEFQIGKLFRASLLDEAPTDDPKRKPRS